MMPEEMKRPADVFADIYRSNRWKGTTPSGPGANLRATANIRRALPLVLRGLGARVLLDAPCGDFNWIREIVSSVERYIGIDIVRELIDSNGQYASERVSFHVADITSDELPTADAVLCRDCFGHLVASDAFSAVAQFQDAGIRYLLTTTFYAQKSNRPGRTGGWRPVNLHAPPFSFPPPLLILPERPFHPNQPNSDKSLGLWELTRLT